AGLPHGDHEAAARPVVPAPAEREMEDDVPVPFDIEVTFKEDLAVRRESRDECLLFLDVGGEGLRRARVDAVLLHEPLLGGLLPVLGDLRGEIAAELANRDR